MSSPAQTPEVVPKAEKEKKGLGRVFSRFRTALKKGDSASSKRQSIVPAGAAVTATPATVAPERKAESGTKAPTTKATEARLKYEAMAGVTKLSRSELFEQRAKKLNERYGLELNTSQWQITVPNDTVLRMDKPIRMRVRRTCHRCNATFGASKECPHCQHIRCTKCSRYPAKRTEAEILASRERRAAIIKANRENPPIAVDYDYEWNNKNLVLKKPSKTGGQDLVHKKPRQRVRRTCHECSTLFIAGSKTCEKCLHTRCTDCPRDPAKKDKYPFGYPGDVFGPNAIPHFECERCKTVYPTGAEHGTPCRNCKHEKSDDSPRALPRKVEPLPDPKVLEALQARLDSLRVA